MMLTPEVRESMHRALADDEKLRTLTDFIWHMSHWESRLIGVGIRYPDSEVLGHLQKARAWAFLRAGKMNGGKVPGRICECADTEWSFRPRTLQWRE